MQSSDYYRLEWEPVAGSAHAYSRYHTGPHEYVAWKVLIKMSVQYGHNNQHFLFHSGIIQSVNLTSLCTQKPVPESSSHTPTYSEPWELAPSLGFLLILLTHVPELCWSPWVVLMAWGERATL